MLLNGWSMIFGTPDETKPGNDLTVNIKKLRQKAQANLDFGWKHCQIAAVIHAAGRAS